MRLSLLVAVLFSLLFVKPASAQKKQKLYTAKVYLTSDKLERGVLHSAGEKGLFLLTRKDSVQFIDLSQIAVIKLRPKNAASRGVIVGLVTGLALGATATLLYNPDDNLETTISAVATAGLSFAGMAIGGSIGSNTREQITVQGNSEKYLGSLNKLKSMAANP